MVLFLEGTLSASVLEELLQVSGGNDVHDDSSGFNTRGCAENLQKRSAPLPPYCGQGGDEGGRVLEGKEGARPPKVGGVGSGGGHLARRKIKLRT